MAEGNVCKSLCCKDLQPTGVFSPPERFEPEALRGQLRPRWTAGRCVPSLTFEPEALRGQLRPLTNAITTVNQEFEPEALRGQLRLALTLWASPGAAFEPEALRGQLRPCGEGVLAISTLRSNPRPCGAN